MTARHFPPLCWVATWSLCCFGVGQAVESGAYADVLSFLPLLFLAALALSGQVAVR